MAGGGIGRFARKKQQLLSQQSDAAPPVDTAATSGEGGGGGQQPNNDNNNNIAASATDNEQQPRTTNNNNDAEMEVERPATAFNSFGNDSDRPATSGSHGFSAIGNMFGNNDDADDINNGMNMDDGNNNFFTASPTEGMDVGFEVGGEENGAFQGFGGFGGGGEEEEQQQQPIVDSNVNESNESSLTKPSAETEAAQASKANNGIGGVGGGKGIGMFAKKRSAATTSTNATATVNVNGAGQKFSPIRNTNAVMNNNSVVAAVENSSVANLSRFDTDLMSKNTENAAVADDSGVNAGGGNNGNESTEEVPKSIPTSGDDVEDDLTEATASTFAMDVAGEVEINDGVAGQEPSATSNKTSPYFSNNAVTNHQMMENQQQKGNDENAGGTAAADNDTTKTSSSPASNMNMAAAKSNDSNSPPPPREDLVIPGISAAANANTTNAQQQQQRSPKLDGNNMKHTSPVEPAKTTEESMPTTTGCTLSPHHQESAINRVSLSPRPPNVMNSLSPKGTSRPSNHNVNQTTSSFSPKGHVGANVDNDDDDNSIVIPGVPAAVANKQPVATTTLQATNNSNVTLNNASVGRGGTNNIRQPGQTMNGNNGNTRTTLPTKTPAKKSSRISATLPRPLLNRQPRTSSFMMNKNTMSTSNSCDIVTEKVTFAVPDSRPAANQNTTLNGTGNKMERRNGHVAGTSLANSARAMNSTAITPDNRRGGGDVGAKQTAAASTPFVRHTSGGDSSSSGSSSNGSSGTCGNNENAVTPTPRTNNQVSTAKTPYKQPNDNMMDVELQINNDVLEDPQPQRRPRSQTITSPPSASTKNPVIESATPRVSNVNPPPSTNMVANNNAPAVIAELSYTTTTNNNSTFHTDETFDELLSQFVDDIREGTDIYEKGKNDLLKLDVDLTHAHAAVLQYRDGYRNLLDEMESIQGMAESIMAEF